MENQIKCLENFTHEVRNVSREIDINSLANYMDTIPKDPYVKEGYRFKSVGWYRVQRITNGVVVKPNSDLDHAIASKGVAEFTPLSTTDFRITQLPQYGLQQSAAYNPVHGNMCRHYPAINTEISNKLVPLLLQYARYFGWNDEIVLLQCQRINAVKERIGIPAVEGFHKDGNLHAAMLIAQRRNVKGAVSQFSLDANGKELILNEVLQPGEIVFWHDKAIWHYATEFEVDGGASEGVRDVILMSIGGEQHMGSVVNK